MSTDSSNPPPRTPRPVNAPPYDGQVQPAPALPKAPVAAMWICLALAWVFFIIPIPGTIFIAGPLNLAALVLAIVCLTRSATLHGVLGLIGTTVVSAIAYIIGLTLMTVGAVALAEVGMQARSEEARAEVVAAVDVSKVTDAQILGDYRSNSVTADRKYENKIVEITGVVSAIDTEFGNSVAYMYAGGNETSINLKFYFVAKEDAEGLSVGEEATIRGKCDGSLGDVRILGSQVLK